MKEPQAYEVDMCYECPNWEDEEGSDCNPPAGWCTKFHLYLRDGFEIDERCKLPKMQRDNQGGIVR